MKSKLLFGAVACCIGTFAVASDDFPSRPITLIIPFTPGGGTDIMGRMMAEKLGQSLGKPVVVSNNPGAGGTIGTELAARAEPDGYTLMIGSVSTISINPSLYKKSAINPLRDLTPVSPVASTPSLLAVPKDLPVTSVEDLIALAKKSPGSINFGSAGQGTSHHLAGELFKMQAGIEATHVPYGGSAPALMGLARGDVQILIANAPSLLPAIEGGRVKSIAVTSLERSERFPEYKTVSESGLPGFEVIVWYGLFAPKGTPAPIIDKLNAEVRRITALPDVKERLAAEGAEPMSATPQEFAKRMQDDYVKWGKVVEAAGAKVE